MAFGDRRRFAAAIRIARPDERHRERRLAGELLGGSLGERKVVGGRPSGRNIAMQPDEQRFGRCVAVTAQEQALLLARDGGLEVFCFAGLGVAGQRSKDGPGADDQCGESSENFIVHFSDAQIRIA